MPVRRPQDARATPGKRPYDASKAPTRRLKDVRARPRQRFWLEFPISAPFPPGSNQPPAIRGGGPHTVPAPPHPLAWGVPA
eukprot:6699820-Pyramimonas_sp.AAC.1